MRPMNLLGWRGRERFTLVVLLTLLPTIALIVLYQFERQRTVRQYTQDMGLQVAESIADQQDAAINGARQLLYALAQTPSIQTRNLPACTSLFAGLLKQNPTYTDIALADDNGEVLASGLPFRPDNVSDRRYFIQARETRDLVSGDYVIDRRTGKPTVHLARPVFDGSETFRGVLFAGLDTEAFTEKFISPRLPPGSTVAISAASGPMQTQRVLFRWPDPSRWVGRELPAELSLLLNDPNRTVATAPGFDGVVRLFSIHRHSLSPQGGEVVILVGIPLATEGAKAMVYKIGGPLLVLALVLLAMWYFGNLLVLGQIKRLVATTQAVARGELGTRTGLENEGGEVGEVAKALDSMAESLAQRQHQREAAEAALLQRHQQLRVLSHAAQQINSVLEVPVVLRQLVASALELTGATGGTAGLIVNGEFIFSEHSGAGQSLPRDYRLAIDRGIAGHVIQTREPYLTNDAAGDPYLMPDIREALAIESMATVPILGRNGEPLGCFSVHNKPAGFEAVDLELLSGLAASAAIAIENSQMVAERRQNEAKYRLLVENQTDLVVKVDLQGRFEFVSPSYCRLFGRTEADLLGKTFLPLAHEDDRAPTEAAMAKLLNPPHTAYIEQRAMTVSGWRWLGWADTAVLDGNGQVISIVGAGRDITERREMEQALADAKAAAEAGSHARDRFLASLSHELRTPLTPVLATLSMLQSAPGIAGDLLPDLQMMQRNIELEARLIDDLLDHTRIARGKLRMDVRPVDTHELLLRAIEVSTEAMDVPRLFIQTELAAVDHTVRADPARLQQVFWNVIKNAMQYTPDGGSLTIRSCNPGPQQIEISFTDTGMGIDPQFIPRIFDAFEQADISSIRRPGGLGLGLAISSSIMQMLGGSIRATSEGEGKGSTFIVQLPTCLAETPEVPLIARPHLESRPLRVLLVDDHAPTLAVMARILRNDRHVVTTAPDVQTALERAQTMTFDILISDIGLPDGTGLDIMRWFVQNRPIPGIALSGYGMETDLESSREAGFTLHLVKPVMAQRLLEAISEAMAAADRPFSSTPA